jgi:hypothetical protein
MRIHQQQQDKSYTLDQHCYVLITLQHFNPNSEFPECETPFPPYYTFSKDNQPVTDHDKQRIIEEQHNLPLCSAVYTLPYFAYNTCANILFAVCKLAKACSPGKANFCALIWLIGCLQRRPYYAIKKLPRHHFQPCLQRMPPTPHTTLQPDRIFQCQLARLPRHWLLNCWIYDVSQQCSHQSQFYHANTNCYDNLQSQIHGRMLCIHDHSPHLHTTL